MDFSRCSSLNASRLQPLISNVNQNQRFPAQLQPHSAGGWENIPVMSDDILALIVSQNLLMATIRDWTLGWVDFFSDPLWLIPSSLPITLVVQYQKTRMVSFIHLFIYLAKPDMAGTYQFGITSMIQNEVFWLEVPINYSFGMQICKSFDYACRIKPGC